MSIYILTHKQFDAPKIKDYVPIHVGAAGKNDDFGYIKDSTGDNISLKNPNYCELTGIYWVWKNTHDDINGFVHYRRYFKYRGEYLPIESAEELLKTYDIIVPKKVPCKESMYDQFLYCGTHDALNLMREIVQEKYPDYLPDYDTFFAGNKAYFLNMMVCKRNLMCDYCSWLFDILGEVENRLDMTGYTDYQKRVYGFLSERLLNIYIMHNKLRVKEMSVEMTEQSFKDKVKFSCISLKNRVSFALHSGH